MRADRLARDAAEVAVVVVPAPRPVGEHGQVVVHPRASRREERLEVDAARPVRLVREQLSRHRPRQLVGRLAVVGLDDAVRDERAEEKRRRPAADDGEVVGAHRVDAGEPDQRDDRRDGEGEHRLDARAPATRGEERHKPEQQQHLADGAREHERDHAQPEDCRARHRRALDGTRQQERDEREGGREERVARQLVEEEDIAGVCEQRGGRRQRRNRAEPARDAEPGDDRERVEHGEAGFAHDGAALEQKPCDDRRTRRPREQRVREDDVRVEELPVDEQVARQVAAGLQGKRDRHGGVHRERDAEHSRRRVPALGEPLEGAAGANDRASRGRHRASVLRALDGPADARATVERRTRCPPPRPRYPSSSPA